MIKFEFYDYNSIKPQLLDFTDPVNLTYCVAYKNETTMTITDPFGSCPYVENGWDTATITIINGDLISMTGSDGSVWNFYSDEN